MRRHRLGVQRQEWPRRKVDHPEVIDAGRFERLGRTGNVLAQQITAALSVQIVLLQPAIDGRERRQGAIGLLPLPVEQFDRHSGEGADLLQDPLLLRGGESPGLAPVRPWFGLEPLETSFLEGVIPIFERAPGDELRRSLAIPGQGMSGGHLFQRR